MLNKKFNSILSLATIAMLFTACATSSIKKEFSTKLPDTITVNDIAQNPEGIEYNKNDNTFFLSSLNATPIIKVNFDGSHKAFTSGEKFPLSTAGLQIDYKNNRLLAAGFNGMELMDKDQKTKGVSFLRVYNLKNGKLKKEINLSHLAPDANAYFANDIAVDNAGNVYISDWYAGLIYKVDIDGKASILWKNKTGIEGGPNGLDYSVDGYLLVSVLSTNPPYKKFGLVKIPVDNPSNTTIVKIDNSKFTGFDGMVIKENGNVVGVTNDQKSFGGNLLIELNSNDNWVSANIINSKNMRASTTVAVTPSGKNFVINQDFSNNYKKDWNIEHIKF